MKAVDYFESYEFKCFDAKRDNVNMVPNLPGDYIVVLREGASLPASTIRPQLCKFAGLDVIYVGQSKDSLSKRDVKQHFNGHAGCSTLRKSLGALMGYNFVPRDKNKPDNGKTKFGDEDEAELSKWMQSNLLLYYCANNDVETLENKLIEKFNPPLNLSKNKHIINADFRKELSRLRKSK